MSKRHNPSFRFKGGHAFSATSDFSDRYAEGVVHYDHSQGHRGHARDVRGAKKFVRSRLRFHDKMKLRKIAKEGCYDDDE